MIWQLWYKTPMYNRFRLVEAPDRDTAIRLFKYVNGDHFVHNVCTPKILGDRGRLYVVECGNLKTRVCEPILVKAASTYEAMVHYNRCRNVAPWNYPYLGQAVDSYPARIIRLKVSDPFRGVKVIHES